MNWKEQLRIKIINFQRRIVMLESSTEEKERQTRVAEEKLLLEIIDILDVLENFGNLDSSSSQIKKTMERLQRKVLRVLEDRLVKPIEFADGKALLGLSKIVDTRPCPELPPGTILETVRRGYKREEHILRPAELITATVPVSST